ncbi:ArsR/SmtB family transcription factor [Gaopeijia maritima]|uniref:Metalloregulator ArsR/SmtB family transcription factor n=1 Tax=Gaopeijia maritima TaxID=3119007 RepID=A0ABU9E7X2_9BACT
MATLTPEVIALVAQRFKALSEPARLSILGELRTGELNVSQIVERTEQSQAAVSKHLRILHDLGFVSRRREGVFVLYGLADDHVFELCDLMCGRIERETEERGGLLSG